jgi:Ca2+-binding EF-hand superfamily protein
MNLAKNKKDRKGILTESDIWAGCKYISIDITEQQAHELYRILDEDKDGVVSL